MSASTHIAVRNAQPADAPWILSLVPRLHEFGPPPWRTIEQMNAAERKDLSAVLNDLDDESIAFLVAEHEISKIRLGFLYAATSVDFFTEEQHAHIKDIVVSKEGEGQGCGRALLAAAEAWAKNRGYRFITLSVFPQNQRARELYERIGYATDVFRMLKTVD